MTCTASRRLLPFLAATLLAAAACSDSIGPVVRHAPKGVAVLNGSGQTGITLADSIGAGATFLPFTGQFDGAAFAIERDTALATSSALAGDLLWVADLGAAHVQTFQMPAASDPSAASFLHGVGGVSFGVTLRAAGSLALVSQPNAATPTVRVVSAGRCPTDVFDYAGSFFVADANADCANFSADGVARLIRFSSDGAAHDTIGLATGAVGTSATVVVSGRYAYVATDGDADFSTFPYTFRSPGVVTKVDMTEKQVVGSVALPVPSYGATMHLGADGKLYVVAYTATDASRQDVFAIAPATMTFTGPRATDSDALDLRITGTTSPSCTVATADALGRIYCVTVDYGSAGASTLYVFNADGSLLRQFAVGQYAVDLALR